MEPSPGVQEQAGEVLERIYATLAHYGLKVLAALVILVVGLWLAKALANLLKKQLNKTKLEQTLINFLYHLCHIGLVVFVLLAVLERLGIKTTSFIAVLGAAGLAIGFALQGSLSNFAAGIMLVIFRPFKVGDFIEAGGQTGAVEEIQIFNTIINSPDNRRIIIPNAQVTGSSVINFTANGTRRIDMVVGVSYEDDLQKTTEIIKQVISEDSRVLAEPAVQVAVSELADSSVNFVVRPWVNAADYWNVKFDLTQNIKQALDANDITIPFPQRDVHLFNEK